MHMHCSSSSCIVVVVLSGMKWKWVMGFHWFPLQFKCQCTRGSLEASIKCVPSGHPLARAPHISAGLMLLPKVIIYHDPILYFSFCRNNNLRLFNFQKGEKSSKTKGNGMTTNIFFFSLRLCRRCRLGGMPVIFRVLTLLVDRNIGEALKIGERSRWAHTQTRRKKWIKFSSQCRRTLRCPVSGMKLCQLFTFLLGL